MILYKIIIKLTIRVCLIKKNEINNNDENRMNKNRFHKFVLDVNS